MEKEIFYTVDDLCRMWKVDRINIYNWVRHGKLKAYKIGKFLRFREEDIKNFVRPREVKTGGKEK